MVDLNLKVPALEMLLEYTASGIGAVAGSMLGPWRARQAATVRLIEAEAEGDSLQLIADAQAAARRSLVEPDETGRGVLDIGPDGIAQRIEFQEKKRQANIASVVREAAAELDDKEAPEHEPDPDWTTRFFDCVQHVSSEDMQKLWSQVLSGEVESPGRTALRTLDILKNMTKEDAELFKFASNFVINDFIFFPIHEQDIDLAIKPSALMQLQEAGLLHTDISLVTTRIKLKDGEDFLRYRNFLLKITSTDKESISIPAIPLTRSGKDLVQMLEGGYSIEYLRSLSKFLSRAQCNLFFCPIVDTRPDGRVRLSSSFIPIEPEDQSLGDAAP